MHRLWLASLLIFSCSENENPFGDAGISKPDSSAQADAAAGGNDASEGDAGSQADSGEVEDAGGAADSGMMQSCAQRPTRMIVLGDSIMACVGAGGKQAATCGPKALHTALSATIAPGLTYENIGVGGAITEDVTNSQLPMVQGGPGHALVLIYIGGNDLAQYIFVSDQEAQAGYDAQLPELLLNWQAIFDFFADTTRFPDGVTILMNTQYNPFDDCTADPYNLSALKIQLLHDFNMNLVTIADSNPSARIADQATPFLGHGHHNAEMICPHYSAGAENWMFDLIHANELGHASFVREWQKITDALYVECN